MARKKPKEQINQCQGVVQDEHDCMSSRQCRRTATNGDRLCSTHRNLLDSVARTTHDKTAWYISKSFKPRRRTKDGGYKKTFIAIPFASQEDAEKWSRCCLPFIWGTHRKGERALSYSYSRIVRLQK